MSGSKNLILILAALLMNCQDAVEKPSSEAPPVKNQYLLSATPGSETSQGTLQLLASAFGQADVATLLKYDVKAFTLTYTTSYKGEPVAASGLIMVPVGITSDAPIVSLQHGTEFRKDDAPSVKGGFQGLEFFASAGYIALMPDFLGYGTSQSIFHPYYDKAHASSTVIDLIKAAKEFLNQEEIAFNEQLFLAGYSEGGYVTLAAAKEIDENPEHGLNVTAVAAGAGGYDLPGMLAEITSGTYYAYPSYLAFVLMAYNETNDWHKPLTYFFQEKYASALQTFLNGEYGGSYINSKLTTHVPSLFNSDFFQRLKDPAGELELKTALEHNSVAGWKTDVPIRLFHGTKDEIIPFSNSEATLEKFKASGSTNVSLTPIPGGTHGSSFEPMLRNFVPWFLGFK